MIDDMNVLSGRGAARLRVLALVVLVAGMLPHGTADAAAENLWEVEKFYGCVLDGEAIRTVFGDVTTSVSVRPVMLGEADLVLEVNERLLFEDPFEMVAFEYLSSCEQARRLIDVPQASKEELAKIILEADCVAIRRLQYEGKSRSAKSVYLVLEILEFGRGGETYMGLSFEDRARNILANCFY